jgi:hypothetical protein
VKNCAAGEAAKTRKDQETERKRKRLLKRSGDDSEDDENIDDEDDNAETKRWLGDGAVPPFHEEEEVIGSIPASDWDDLEQERRKMMHPSDRRVPSRSVPWGRGRRTSLLGRWRWTTLPRMGSLNNMPAGSGLAPMRHRQGQEGPCRRPITGGA